MWYSNASCTDLQETDYELQGYAVACVSYKTPTIIICSKSMRPYKSNKVIEVGGTESILHSILSAWTIDLVRMLDLVKNEFPELIFG